MFLLLLVVGLNALLGVLFKLFPRWGVYPLGAIVVNYWVCVITGSIMVGTLPISAASLAQPWALPSIALGVGFVTGFYLISWVTGRSGIATSTLAGKLSLVIPAAVALYFFPEEKFHWTKIAGIVLAFPALYLSTGDKKSAREKEGAKAVEKESPSKSKKSGKIGLAIGALFILSGVLDSGISVLTRAYFRIDSAHTAQMMSTVHLFAGAALAGTTVLLYQQQRGFAPRLTVRTLLGGLLLGIPNYFSVYFLMRLLSEGPMQPSVALPIVNIAIVTVAVLLAIFVFREGGGMRRWTGLALAITAIFLLSFIDIFGGK
jgi:drug/metabolite transporter (DMT)-like permease